MNAEYSLREEAGKNGSKETISSVFDYLLERSGEKIVDIAPKIGVSPNTLYTIKNRRSERADIKLLKKIADYFGVDVTIFCGLNVYEPPVKLSEWESDLVKLIRDFSESDKERMIEIVARIKESPNQMDFIEKFLSITEKAQARFMETIEDALANPKNLR